MIDEMDYWYGTIESICVQDEGRETQKVRHCIFIVTLTIGMVFSQKSGSICDGFTGRRM